MYATPLLTTAGTSVSPPSPSPQTVLNGGRRRTGAVEADPRPEGAGGRLVRSAAGRGEPGQQDQQDRYVSTTESGSSSANGSNVPLSPADRTSSEKNRVMTRPSRNSPSVGSGLSP